jgi:lysophospholipase L1-like esterase
MTREAAELGSVGILFYRYSHLCRLVLSKYASWRIGKKYRADWLAVNKENGFHEADWVKVENEYQKMLFIAKRIGAQMLILHIPQKGPWTESHNYPSRRLEKWARENAVAFLDLLPAMKRASAVQRLYYARDGHCTPEGYAIIADDLANYLMNKNLVP